MVSRYKVAVAMTSSKLIQILNLKLVLQVNLLVGLVTIRSIIATTHLVLVNTSVIATILELRILLARIMLITYLDLTATFQKLMAVLAMTTSLTVKALFKLRVAQVTTPFTSLMEPKQSMVVMTMINLS